MNSSLSEDEFQRMQIQLLELRTQNYQYEDQCKKKERELSALRLEVQHFEKDLQKANKVINKSKKIKEVELLVQENDNLQMKLNSQEEDFRLQNDTLMQELNNLVTANEELEKKLKGGENSTNLNSSESSTEDEVRRLQAQNSALQKNLKESQDQYNAEVGNLKVTVAELEAECAKLSGKRMTPVGENTNDAEGQSDHDTSFQEQHTSGGETVLKTYIQNQVDEQNEQINDLRLKLDTEKEEKSLLLEKLQQIEKSSKTQMNDLHEEVEKLSEKFKKKQESFVQLQEEKEKMYTSLTEQIQALDTSKTTEVKKLSVRSESLQSDLAQCSQALEELRQSSTHKISELENQLEESHKNYKMLEQQEERSYIRIKELENLVANLKEEIDEGSLEQSQSLVNQLDRIKQENYTLKKKNETMQKEIEKLNDELKESRDFHQTDMSEKQALQQDRDVKLKEIMELNKVAEKRKSLLDELAIKYQSAIDQHREQTKTMEETYSAKVAELSQHIEDIEKKLRKLLDIESKLEESQKQVQSLDNTKSWLERTLKETDENIEKLKQSYEEQLVNRDKEHDEAVKSLQNEHKSKLQEINQLQTISENKLQEEIDRLTTEVTSRNEDISKLKQELTDNFDEKKIHEKKGLTVVKDLKKQLHGERKRADKLQQRLQDYLQSDTKSRTSVEELLRQDVGDKYFNDNVSVSSWSTGLYSSRDSSHVQSPNEEEAVLSPSTVEQEHTDLLKRIADLQNQKWTLETKVAHLESSNASMCEDLLNKTAVIEHYVMHSKTGHISSSSSQDKLSLKNVIDFVKNKGDDDMREMNRKLQAILEETLTKNMHLEKDMETLSEELVRLSKQAIPLQTSTSCQQQSTALPSQSQPETKHSP